MPIVVGQTTVNPGDIIVGDADGILAVPQAEAEAIAALTEQQNAVEAEAFRSIANGAYDRSWVDKTLLAKGFLESALPVTAGSALGAGGHSWRICSHRHFKEIPYSGEAGDVIVFENAGHPGSSAACSPSALTPA